MNNERRSSYIGTVNEYVDALRNIKINANYRKILIELANSGIIGKTSHDLAKNIGYKDYRGVNSALGKTGKMITKYIKLYPILYDSDPNKSFYTSVLAEWHKHEAFIMHDELIKAVEQLGWTSGAAKG